MKTKEQFTAEVLESLTGLTSASAPPGLEAKIIARLPAAKNYPMLSMPTRRYWLAAAGLLLLLGINVYLLSERSKGHAAVVNRKEGANVINAEYFVPPPSI